MRLRTLIKNYLLNRYCIIVLKFVLEITYIVQLLSRALIKEYFINFLPYYSLKIYFFCLNFFFFKKNIFII
jgi:hypothetical protein